MESQSLKVASASLDTTPLDWDRNLDAALAAVEEARRQGVDILVLPRLCLSGVGCGDAFLHPFVRDEALSSLRRLVEACAGISVAAGLPLEIGGRVYDAAAIVDDRRLVGFACRRLFPSDDRLDDSRRWFSSWDVADGGSSSVDFDGRRIPVRPVFRLKGGEVAVSIGGEVWNRPGFSPSGASLCLDLSARPFSFGEQAGFESAVARASASPGSGAGSFGIPVASANLCGNEAGQLVYAGGAVVAVNGVVAARSRRFSFGGVHLAVASLGGEASADASPAPADPLSGKNDEFPRAVALGMFDYLRKTWSHGFTLSLSGGADSAAIACLVRLLAAYGVRELGGRGFMEALHWKGDELPCGAPVWKQGDGDEALEAFLDALMPSLLATAYQGTANSSDVTRNAAAAVARDVGSRHGQFDIDEMVAAYRARAQEVVGREFSWGRDDLTLQNIQARVRGPGIWMVANARNDLLLVTSNRSEAAVGYATMDGDTCGGLAPIVGVDKAWLRQWLRWLEVTAPVGGRPFPSLALVNAQAPTAELRPREAKQTDEGDLMPYAILDEIERLAVHRMRSPQETLAAVEASHPDVDRAVLKGFVSRFFRMLARSQWKRSKCAPGFHLDDADLSPTSWFRFPVLSGGFSRELARLEGEEGREIPARAGAK